MKRFTELLKAIIASFKMVAKNVLRGGLWVTEYVLDKAASVVTAPVDFATDLVTHLGQRLGLVPYPEELARTADPQAEAQAAVDRVQAAREQARQNSEPTSDKMATLIQRAAKRIEAGKDLDGIPARLQAFMANLSDDHVSRVASVPVAKLADWLEGAKVSGLPLAAEVTQQAVKTGPDFSAQFKAKPINQDLEHDLAPLNRM